MDDLYTRFDNVFFEKTRLSILTVLYKDEMVSFNQLKSLLGGTDGSIYTHMEKLIKAGYVEKRKELAGSTVQTVYKITKEGKSLFKEYLAFLEQMLKENR
ncbi:transcriptional regulator [Spirochaeta isovalerica]|uniref:DNA-binding MarR family transcriptional regulator n=1 Tax=Spirochaeta isovalerica TaxID=150 RepID=A0A841R9X8_9SPIO|nr:transcriptional regulator [Spirochaeta isovalerica]MBB6480705.1 DNA-binding MarR family transcriptional regulator [Spirochaeta isovalerica]